jgi:short-subunit dehydrogenase
MLVLNAGVVHAKTMLDLSPKEIDISIDLNLKNHFYMIKQVLPKFIDQNHGHILSVSSVMGLTGTAGLSDYNATKFAVNGLMESLRQELSNTNVCVSCIFPGLVKTGMFTGVKHSYEWFTPELEVEHVSGAMLDCLEGMQSREVVMPVYGTLLPLLKMFPIELSDLFKYYVGNNDYKGFKHSHSKLEFEKLSK